MSDLDNYTKLLAEQSSRRLQLERSASQQKPASVFQDAVQCERALIASRLLVHYKSGVLTLEDIAIATGLSMSPPD